MGRKYVRVDIPRSQPDRLITLAKKLVATHESEGTKSPFSEEQMTRFRETLTSVTALHDEAEALTAKAVGTRHCRNELLGIAEGQNLGSADSLLCQIVDARKQLEVHCRGHEQTMEIYGFDVVVGVARSSKPKEGAPATGIA